MGLTWITMVLFHGIKMRFFNRTNVGFKWDDRVGLMRLPMPIFEQS